MERENILHWANLYANCNGWKLGEHADEIAATLSKNGGYCPCTASPTPAMRCPCVRHVSDILDKGKCFCGFFENAQR